MNINRALPILWLPLIALWTFLFALQSNLTSTNLDEFVPLIAYLIVSFLFVLQLQLVLGNKKESSFVKFGTANFLSICLSISSLSILLNLFQSIDNQWSLVLIISPLIINTIFAELFSVSNKAIIKKKNNWVKTNQKIEEKQISNFEESSKGRNLSIQIRDEWKDYLDQAFIRYENIEIKQEIARIKEILNYSSYFRSSTASNDLRELKREVIEEKVLLIMKNIK